MLSIHCPVYTSPQVWSFNQAFCILVTGDVYEKYGNKINCFCVPIYMLLEIGGEQNALVALDILDVPYPVWCISVLTRNKEYLCE